LNFSHGGLVPRLVICCISIVIVAALCYFHGLSGRTMAMQQIDQMIETGNLTGKFWKVINIQDGQVTLTKYHLIITLSYSGKKKIQRNDKISFLAKVRASKDGVKVWYPVRLRNHGSSTPKFILSFFSVVIVFVMIFRYFGFDKKTLSFVFKQEKANA